MLPLATALAGAAALLTGSEKYYSPLTQAFITEMFVTLSFPLVMYAAVASPKYGMTRNWALVWRWGSIAVILLFVAWPVYVILGVIGLAFFCYLMFATYSGWFIDRKSVGDQFDLRRVLFPLGAWWTVALLVIIVSVVLEAVGIEVGEYVYEPYGEDYHRWPEGWLVGGTAYFAVLTWLELTGAYDPGSAGGLGALFGRHGAGRVPS